LSQSRFDPLNAFIRKRHRWIIVAWVIVAIACLTVVPLFFSSVSYNVTGGFGGPSNSESQKAANILNAEFPNSNNESLDTVLVVLQGAQVYSDAVRDAVLGLNQTVANDSSVANFTGESSLYTVEYGLLFSSLPSLVPQVASLEPEVAYANAELYSLEQGINQTAQLVYGVPAAFVQAWQGVTSQGVSDPYAANAEANATVINMTDSFGGNANSTEYYSVFFPVWNSTFQSLPNSTSVLDREAFAVNQSVSMLLNSSQVGSQMAQMITTVASGLNVTDWNQADAIGNYTITLSESNFAQMLNASSGFSAYQFLNATYYLGQSPSFSQVWDLASAFVADGAQTAFSGSPLFSVNSTSLANLLSALPENATAAEVDEAVANVVSTQPFQDYPFMPTNSLTQNFVSTDNSSMLVILDFSSYPDAGTIARVKLDVQGSNLENLGTVYVTGGSVVTHDVEDAFSPALTLTVGPGIVVAILIVGLLFLSPVAALLPVLMGGVSVEVSLAAIYIAIVGLGHGNITFLTPTLTILLMLGLSVDYAVLQLRRTREERLLGKSVEDSVGVSVRWAGQAVLTAGVTVIVAYIVMALANVPIFSSVATSIALGVGILLAVSLTLLPSLEIALGDRVFWPALKRSEKSHSDTKKRLRGLANGVLKRKALVVVVISLLALSAFYIEYSTPTGLDFLRLIPNFQSNQGLTVITNSFGSGATSPTQLVVTTPTMITYGNNQFNQTLLDQIETICLAVAGSKGVVSVSSPTRPFGSLFNYSDISSMPEPLMLQYEEGMFSMIGSDNKTALINVGLSSSSGSPDAVSSLLQLESNVGKVSLLNGVTVHYGGDTQSTYDSESFIAGLLPEVVAILAAAVYVILFIQLRSAFTPIRLIFTILCGCVLSLALLSLVFYSWLGLPILDFAPLFVVVTMLGVGIDYDIFFVTRIREEALNGKTDDEAIKTAVDKIWVTILGLGLVLATVFASLLITGIAILQEISLTVTAAILLDVLVVIPFFVPSLMGLAQKFNWWPSKIHRTKQAENNTS
jgi:RND superfamily putative drug exporter